MIKIKFTLPYIIYGLTLVPTANANAEKSTGSATTELEKSICTNPDAAKPTHCTTSGCAVIYVYSDGSTLKRQGGTRAWRNSNPGNLRYSEKTRQCGAIGQAGGFAVFSHEEAGRLAIKMLLLSDSYRNLTIADAIYKYAPPHENNTNGYKSYIKKVTGLNLDKKITTLTSQELEKVIQAICVIEGWKRGHEIKTAAPIRTKQTTK